MINNESIIHKLSYHDAEIIDITYNDNNLILKINDGWNIGQVNELVFVNGKENSKYDLLNRFIYQFDNIEKNDEFYNFSLLIWMKELDGMLLEKVNIEANDIIVSIYDNDELIEKKSLNDEIGG